MSRGGAESAAFRSTHKAEAEFVSALLGVRCWLSSVMREAISLLNVARSPLNAADALEERDARRRATRALFLRHRLGQFEQAPQACRKPGAIFGDPACATDLGRVGQK